MALAVEMKPVGMEDELQKNPELKSSDLEHLRTWLETQQHLPEISDMKLITFYHSCFFDMTLTKETIEHHYTMRTNAPEFFTDRDVTGPELAKALQVVNISPLPVLDPNGNRIVYIGLNDTDPNNFVPEDGIKLIYMTIDMAGIKEGTVSGYHTIFDMKGAKLMHLARLTLSTMKKFVLYGEKGLPIRRKEIHMVNVVPWIDKLMLLVKPWMSKHTADNLYFHGEDMESLHKHIPKSCLPKELGGDLKSLEVFHAANCDNLKGLREHFAEEETLRVDESKRIKRVGGQDDEELQGTFRKLDID